MELNFLVRIDGHATETVKGDKYWYINNELHRIDGPALISINDIEKWYSENKEYNDKEKYQNAL